MYQLIKKLEEFDELKLQKYLSKFVIQNIPSKDECCLKYCIRPSCRHCYNCPNHPMLETYGSKENKHTNNLLVLIHQKRYKEFIKMLKKSGFPFPVEEELENILKDYE